MVLGGLQATPRGGQGSGGGLKATPRARRWPRYPLDSENGHVALIEFAKFDGKVTEWPNSKTQKS
jgi:hypothetical protein